MKRNASPLWLALLMGVVLGGVTTVSFERESQSIAETSAPVAIEPLPVTEVSPPTAKAAVAGLPDFTALVKQLEQSVVNISTETENTDTLEGRHGMQNPFDFYFGGPRKSLGSGFVFDASGYIITNHHVVEDATKVVVRFHDEREFEAKVIGGDPKTDLAVIRVESSEDFVPLPLGDSEQLEVGEWVLAVGNPFGLDHSVTAGIVSAKGRRIHRRNPYDDFIQTDAAINPGNSGGPLVNLRGQVVGVNTAIFSNGGGNIGIGFAIPVDMARGIVPQLKETGHVTRGWLGVKIQLVDEDIAASLGLSENAGALVAEVFEGSPADEGGLVVGDVITHFDAVPVAKSTDLPSIVAVTPVGKKVDVTVIRDGEEQTIGVTIAKLEEQDEDAKPVKAGTLGLSVQDLTPELVLELDLPEDVIGVVVSSVTGGSPASEAGIRPGDVIEMVGNTPVESASVFQDLLDKADPSESVLVLVRRGDQTLFRVIKPAKK